MGLVEVPIVLGRGLFAFLRDFHRHALCGLALFLPLSGLAYVLARPLIGAYLCAPVLVIVLVACVIGVLVACVIGVALGLWIGAIVKGIDEHLHGGAREIVDLIDAMFRRPFTWVGLFLFSGVLALGMFLVIALLIDGFGWRVSHFGIRSALLLLVGMFAVTSCVVVLERAGLWRAVSRCFSLSRGRRWFAVLSLVAVTLLANGIYLGLRLIGIDAYEGFARVHGLGGCGWHDEQRCCSHRGAAGGKRQPCPKRHALPARHNPLLPR